MTIYESQILFFVLFAISFFIITCIVAVKEINIEIGQVTFISIIISFIITMILNIGIITFFVGIFVMLICGCVGYFIKRSDING